MTHNYNYYHHLQQQQPQQTTGNYRSVFYLFWLTKQSRWLGEVMVEMLDL